MITCWAWSETWSEHVRHTLQGGVHGSVFMSYAAADAWQQFSRSTNQQQAMAAQKLKTHLLRQHRRQSHGAPGAGHEAAAAVLGGRLRGAHFRLLDVYLRDGTHRQLVVRIAALALMPCVGEVLAQSTGLELGIDSNFEVYISRLLETVVSRLMTPHTESAVLGRKETTARRGLEHKGGLTEGEHMPAL